MADRNMTTTTRFWRLRKLIRDTTSPIPQPLAKKWDTRLGRMYNIMAFTCLVGSLYAYFKMRREEAEKQGLYTETDAEYYVRTMNLKDVTVKRFSLFGKTLMDDFIKDPEEFKEKRMMMKPGTTRIRPPKSDDRPLETDPHAADSA